MSQQHTSPCRECPWRRNAPPGWLGGSLTAEDWIRAAHAEEVIYCHIALKHECAGAAIFRGNVCKRPRSAALVLPQDKVKVFSWNDEFIAHHTRQKPSEK